MDEIVFLREKLKREMAEGIEALEKAAASYDPESDVPAEDLLAALTFSIVGTTVNAYGQAVADRIKVRSETRKADGR